MKEKSQMTAMPCPRCLPLARAGDIRTEMLQQLPAGAFAPLDLKGKPCCHDCQAADTLIRVDKVYSFEMARVAVGNDRLEQYRMPGIPMGLVSAGLMRPSQPGDHEKHLKWLDENNWFECDCGWDD